MKETGQNPLVSVLLPTRQSREHLDARIESILSQGVSEIEVINVDTQSSDGTVEALSIAFGTRLQAIQHPPGLYGAWNRAIRAARGDFLHFATSDDFEDPSFYKCCIDVLRRHPEADCVSTQWTAVDASGRRTVFNGWDRPPYRRYLGCEPGRVQHMDPRRSLFYTLFFGYPAGVCNGTLFRASAFEKAGLFPETYGPCGDWGWWLAASAKCNHWMIDEPLAHWRVCEGQATTGYARFNRYRNELRLLRDTLQVLDWQRALDFLEPADLHCVHNFIRSADTTLGLAGLAFYARLLVVQPDKVLHAVTKKIKPHYAPFWITRLLHGQRLRPADPDRKSVV